MEAKSEDTRTMTMFFNLLNEMLQKVSGKKKYKFNHGGSMLTKEEQTKMR